MVNGSSGTYPLSPDCEATIPSKSLGKGTVNLKQQQKQNHGIAQRSRKTHCKIRGKQTLDDMASVEKGLLVLGRFTDTDGDEVEKLAHDVILFQTVGTRIVGIGKLLPLFYWLE